MTSPTRSAPATSPARTVLAAVGGVLGLVLTLPLVVLALPLWAMRGLVSAAASLVRRVRPEETGWDELIEYAPEVGWRPRPDLDVHARAGGLFHLTTDPEGWRGPLRIEEADVVAMGDSFAFGQGADDEELFTEFVPGLRAKAVGANGYNLVQSYLWMERLASRLDGKTVVWLVYYDNDLLENLRPHQQRYRMPFVRETDGGEGWEIVTGHVSPEPWPFPGSRRYTDRLAEICTPTRLSRRAFAAADFLVRRAADTCAAAGAGLAVVGIPAPEQVHPDERRELAGRAPDPDAFDARLPDRRLAEICGALDVPFLPLNEHLGPADYLPDDCHWSLRGHREVGRLLGELHGRARSPGGETPTVDAVRPAGRTASAGRGR